MSASDVQKIGKYEVLAELGQGGYGRVYRAFDPTVGRPVAIKILTAESSRDLLTRFRNEATAAGNLRHRNIVTVYDYGEYNGRPYLVMELLEGEDLTQVIANRTPLSLLQKMNIMDQIASGLDCAHQNGVLHRDVKPANIRILPDGTVKIMDFGIARVNSDENATRLTQQGDLIGTILYMSPEQFAGAEADALCDIFAYGLIYFELLTGKHPFRSSDPRAVMFKITMEDPEPVRALVPDCPEGLEKILTRALHKDRELRYQNLRDLQLDAEPLIFELRQARAASLVTEATELRGAHSQRALVLINEALNLDPSNRDARQLRESVQSAIQREVLQPRIESLLQTAQKQVAERLFAQAVQTLESALKLDRANERAAASLDSVREQIKRVHEATVPAAAALAHLSRREWLDASAKSVEAGQIDPLNPAVIRVREEIEKHVREVLSGIDSLIESDDFLDSAIRELDDLAILQPESGEIQSKIAVARLRQQAREQAAREARERQLVIERVANLEAQARTCADLEDFAGAIQILETALQSWPQEHSLNNLLRTTRDAQEKWQREQERLNSIRTALEHGGQFLKRGLPADAVAILNQACSQYPDEPELQSLLKEADAAQHAKQHRQAVERVLADAQANAEDHDFAAAIRAIEIALQQWPDDTDLTSALLRFRVAQQAWQRRQAVAKVSEESEELAGRHLYAQALEAVDAGLREYPDEFVLVELRQALRAKFEAEQRSRAITRALEEGAKLLRQGKLEEAVPVLTSACGLYPDEPELKGLLEQAQAAQHERERQQAIAKVVEESQQLARGHRYRDALDRIQQGLTEHPDEPALLEVRLRLQSQWEEEQRTEAIRTVLEHAATLLRQGRLEEAIRVLTAACAQYPDEPELQNFLQHAQAAQHEQARQQAIARVVEESQHLAQGHRYRDALDLVQQGLTEHPDEPALLELRLGLQSQWEDEQRIEAIRNVLNHASTLLRQGRLEEAIRVLTAACAQYPDEPELKTFLQRAEAARHEQERQQAIAKVVEESQHLARGHHYRDALDLIQQALTEHPDEPALLELRLRLQSQWEDEQRTEAIRTVLGDAATLIRQGRLEEAIQVLTSACAQYPEEPELQDLLQQAQAAQHEQHRQQAIARVVEESQHLARGHRYRDALDLIQQALTEHPDEPALLELRLRLQSQWEDEQRTEAIRTVLDDAATLLRQGRLEEAIQVLTAACAQYPEEIRLQQLLREARQTLELQQRRDAITKAAADAQQLSDREQYTAAIATLESGLKSWPGEAVLTSLLRTTREARARAERRKAIGQVLDLAQRLIGQNRPSEALDAVQAGLRTYSGEPELLALERRLTDQLEAARRAAQAKENARLQKAREAVEKIAVEARGRAEREDFAAAIEILTKGLKSWPKETRLSDLLKETRKAREQWERKKAAPVPPRVEAVPAPAPVQAVPLPARVSRTHLFAGAAAVLAITALAALSFWGGLFHSKGPVALTLKSNVEGASIAVNGQSCVMPNCALKLPPGNYKLAATKAGFAPLAHSFSVKANSGDIVLPLVFVPLPQLLQVNTNFATGRVFLDGAPAGELHDGQFSLDSISSGLHTIRVTGGDAEFEARWREEPGTAPELTRPINARNVQATLLANVGENGTLACNCDVRTVQVDGKEVPGSSAAGGLALALGKLKEGSRRITASDRSLLVDIRPNPALNVFLSLDRNVGTLVVETGQDNATVFINNRPYRRLTGHGLLRVPVDVGEYSIRVEKPGFRSPPETKVAVAKGEEKQVSLALTQMPASLEISGAQPGALVKLDGKPVGETGPTGALRTDVAPGDHEIEITKNDYGPARFQARFTPGQATRPRPDQITMARLTQPPPRPDPRQIETQDWEKVRNSNSLEELDEFIRKHPGSSYAENARARISQIRQQSQADAARQAEQAAWDSLDKTRKAAVQDFLARYGAGPHQQEARALITDFEKREAEALAAARLAAEQQKLNEQKEKDVLADQQSILRTLAQYESAYNAKDLKGLQNTWRDMPKSVFDIVRDQFGYARSLAFQIKPVGSPLVNGDSATVICTRSLNLTTSDNQRVNSGNERVQVTLERVGQTWFIRSIAKQ